MGAKTLEEVREQVKKNAVLPPGWRSLEEAAPDLMPSPESLDALAAPADGPGETAELLDLVGFYRIEPCDRATLDEVHRRLPRQLSDTAGDAYQQVRFVVHDLIQNADRHSEELPGAPRSKDKYREGDTTKEIVVGWNLLGFPDATISVSNSDSYLFDPTFGLCSDYRDNAAAAAVKSQKKGSGYGFLVVVAMTEKVELEWKYPDGEIFTVRVTATFTEDGGGQAPAGATLEATRSVDGVSVPLSKDDFLGILRSRPHDPCETLTVTAYLKRNEQSVGTPAF